MSPDDFDGTEEHGGAGLARSTDPVTSHMAADELGQSHAEQLENEILAIIRSHGTDGCISEQVLDQISRRVDSVTPRYISLEKKGLIVRLGATRPARTGRQQLIMVAAQEGKAQIPLFSSKEMGAKAKAASQQIQIELLNRMVAEAAILIIAHDCFSKELGTVCHACGWVARYGLQIPQEAGQ